MELVLASQSPRRHELLGTIGLTFHAQPADVDESWSGDDGPRNYVERLAQRKVAAVADALGRPDGVCVLAADTTVDLDDQVLGKPTDDDDARRMLRSLSGRTHRVHTAVAGWTSGAASERTVTTDVTFIHLDDEAIDWYLGFGEHRDKAGAYGMQSAGGALVARIDGSPTNVIGLPLTETIVVLQACGVAVGGWGVS